MGVDVVTKTGEKVVSPVSGTYNGKFDPYKGKSKEGLYSGVEIKAENGDMVQVMYVNPNAAIRPGQKVTAGKTQVGTAQDITPSYPPRKDGVMTNHIHVEVETGPRNNKQFKDPTSMVTQPGM